MEDQPLLRKRIVLLLIIGGAIVAASFVDGLIFGVTTWRAWWIANGLHLLGGAYAFFFARAIFLYTKPQHQTNTKLWMEVFIFIAGAIILGVFWEWYELIVDRFQLFILGQPSIMTYADNIGDLIFDALGGIIAGIYYWKKHVSAK